MHYVWQMNDGRWHIDRTTSSKQPRLACEDHGYETKREAMGALDPIARWSWERDPRPREIV